MENPTLEEPRKRNRLGGEYDPCAVGDKDNARMAQFFVKRGLPVPWAEAGARAAGGSFLQAQRRREAIKGHKSDLAREARLERKLDETVSIVDQLAWQSACAKARAAGEPLPPPPTGRPAAEDPAPACPAPSPRRSLTTAAQA